MVMFSDEFVRMESQRLKANYLVVVQSYKSREKRTIVHSGVSSLKEAIKMAREKFILKCGNERGLFYRVQVQIGDKELVVPREVLEREYLTLY